VASLVTCPFHHISFTRLHSARTCNSQFDLLARQHIYRTAASSDLGRQAVRLLSFQSGQHRTRQNTSRWIFTARVDVGGTCSSSRCQPIPDSLLKSSSTTVMPIVRKPSLPYSPTSSCNHLPNPRLSHLMDSMRYVELVCKRQGLEDCQSSEG
jgi:hypothetical protein